MFYQLEIISNFISRLTYSRRSVQTVMVNQNMIKWLVQWLGKTEQISDYTLGEYDINHRTYRQTLSNTFL